MSSSRTWLTRSVEETRRVGSEIAAEIARDGCLLLVGDLGAGKTALVRGVAERLGIDPDDIQSPTYTLMREHLAGDIRLLHLDLYRLEPDQVQSEGFEELLLGPGVKAVEWAERLPFELPGSIALAIERNGTERRIRTLDPAQVREMSVAPG